MKLKNLSMSHFENFEFQLTDKYQKYSLSWWLTNIIIITNDSNLISNLVF